MKKIDIIFAILCGLSVAWIAKDFFGEKSWIFFIVLPLLSIIGLYAVVFLGKKFPFIEQVGKFVLIGSFADVIDIKVYQLLFWLTPASLLFKGISFLIAVAIKYWLNKHWAFDKPGQDGIKKEVAQFFSITLGGLLLNIGSFYYYIQYL